MPDWKSRLTVKYNDGGADKTITPIDSFQPSFSLPAEPLHSIEDHHIGVIYSIESISFSMTVKAIGTVAAELTNLALAGTRFVIALEESDGTDWSFSKILLQNCVITNASPAAANPTGAPTATFSGFALGKSVS